MAGRVRLDDLTSDQLDALYAERDRLAGEVARLTVTAEPEYGLRLRDGTVLTFDTRAERDVRQARFERVEWAVTPLTRQVVRAQRTDWTDDAALPGPATEETTR
jgi:hypothetical protein